MRSPPRLRVVLLVVNLAILLLPLGGVALLRLHETTLLRQTESELIAQAAFVRAAYRLKLGEVLRERGVDPATYGAAIDPAFLPGDVEIQPILPQLDRAADPILPSAPDPPAAAEAADGAAQVAGAAVTEVLLDATRTTLAGMRIVDPKGTIVGTSRGELGLSLADREEVRRALRGEPVRVMRARISDEPSPPLESISRGTRVRVFVALPVIEGDRVWGAVLMSRTPVDAGKALYEIRGYLITAAVAVLLVVLLVSLFTSFTIVRPVQALIAQSARVTRGERGAARELESPVTHEVAQLSRAIAEMAAALEQRAAYIDTFASNVSHEFKTPLTSIRGTVELLRDHLDEMTEGERSRFLENLEADAERLGRLVGRLLELARADVVRPRGEASEAAEVIEAQVSRARAGGLEVAVEVEEGLGQARVGREVLESILHNLLDNARQHGGQGVQVALSARRVGGVGEALIEIEVRDNGPGISPANLARVFDRFFTTARSSGGSGLGLSIVKALIEAHRGEIALESDGGGTTIRVRLPAN